MGKQRWSRLGMTKKLENSHVLLNRRLLKEYRDVGIR